MRQKRALQLDSKTAEAGIWERAVAWLSSPAHFLFRAYKWFTFTRAKVRNGEGYVSLTSKLEKWLLSYDLLKQQPSVFFWEAAGLSSGGCDDAVVLRRNAFCRHAAICVQISSSLMNTNQMLCFSSTDICCNVSSITLFHQSSELLDQKISLYCKLGIKETKSKCWGLIVCHKGKLVFNGIVHSKIKKRFIIDSCQNL